MNVMETFLLNLLLLLGVVWMLLGIGYFGYQMWQSREPKREQSKAKKEVDSVTSDVMSEEIAPHDLVGKSRPFVPRLSRKFPPFPRNQRRMAAGVHLSKRMRRMGSVRPMQPMKLMKTK